MSAVIPQLERLHIEVTNVCNFKCEFCPDGIMQRRRGHMEPALLEQILEEVAATGLARVMAFHLMGEPLLYPYLFEGIRRAAELGLRLHLTSNGSTFALWPEHIEKLNRSLFAKLTISLQTPDPVTFSIRGAPPRLTPERYFAGITQFLQVHLRSSSPTQVHLKFLDTSPHPFLVPHKALSVIDSAQQMRAQLSAWARRALQGIPDAPALDWVEAQIATYRPGRWQQIRIHPRLVLETFPLDSWGNVETDRVIPARWGYCNGASGQAGILYDGTVVPCCKDYEGQIPLGQVTLGGSLAEILRGQPACALRRGFNRLQVNHPVCQRCMGGDTCIKALARQVGSVVYFKVYRPWKQRLDPGWGQV
ncbi:radical SAM protein [Synechococcus sp. W60.1]|uniref:radical SAM/SPASM domain-containing protein n=1 Tax=Synechococcus sp. W60.1 TaxID=2964516 RepID=UPI0039C34E41